MLEIYILISALTFLILYFYIKKFTNKIDEQTLLEPIKSDVYPKFCDICDEKIRQIKDEVLKENFKFLNIENKDEFLEKLGDLSRKLTFIQTMNLSKKNDEIWQNELFNFLKELENLILNYLNNGEKIADDLRNYLFDEFNKLKK